MSTGHLTGSVPFGPVNAVTRTYAHTIATLPNGDWCIGFQFRADLFRGNTPEFLWLRTGMTGFTSGGNDYYIGYAGNEYQVNTARRNHLSFRMLSGGISLTSVSQENIGTTTLVHGVTYWVILQRTGSNIEFWVVAANTTAVTADVTTAYNSASPFGSKTLQAGSFGYQSRANVGTFFYGTQALSAADITNIAAGVDPDTIISGGNQKSYFAFATPAATLTNAWTGSSCTQVGTWTNTPTGPQLQARPTGNQILFDVPRPHRPYPIPYGGGSSIARLTGTYFNYTPTDLQYQILLLSNLSVVQSWASLTSFLASAGAWSGNASLPEGGPYVLQFRDANTPTIVYNASNPVTACATMFSIGQSPMAILDGANAGATVSNTLLGYYQSTINTAFAEPMNEATGDAGYGFAALSNQYGLDSSSKPVAVIATAVVGTGIDDWAGRLSFTLSGSASFTVGETVQIKNGGTVRGTAVVTASGGGTALSLKWSTVSPIVGNTILGLTSAASQTVSVAPVSPFGLNCAITYPLFLAAVDAVLPEGNCEITLEWLNGANDTTNLAGIPTGFDLLMARLDSDLGSRNITYKFVIIPHNRQTTSGTACESVRVAQYNWAIGRVDYNTKTFVGIQIQDWFINAEAIGKTCQATSNTTTLVHLAADSDANGSDFPTTITFTGGTNSGLTRTGTAYNATTQLLTVTPALPIACDGTSVYTCYGTGPHEGVAGQVLAGTRMGRDLARRYGHTTASAFGPTIVRATMPPGSDGTIIDAEVLHPVQGRSLRTPNGGLTATNVYGLEVSSDSFSTTKTISSITIISPTKIRIILASPASITGLQVKYLRAEPVPAASFTRLLDTVYDDTGFNTNGNPVWFTPAAVNVQKDYSPMVAL